MIEGLHLAGGGHVLDVMARLLHHERRNTAAPETAGSRRCRVASARGRGVLACLGGGLGGYGLRPLPGRSGDVAVITSSANRCWSASRCSANSYPSAMTSCAVAPARIGMPRARPVPTALSGDSGSRVPSTTGAHFMWESPENLLARSSEPSIGGLGSSVTPALPPRLRLAPRAQHPGLGQGLQPARRIRAVRSGRARRDKRPAPRWTLPPFIAWNGSHGHHTFLLAPSSDGLIRCEPATALSPAGNRHGGSMTGWLCLMNQMKASSKDGSVTWMRSTRTVDSDSASSERGSAPAGVVVTASRPEPDLNPHGPDLQQSGRTQLRLRTANNISAGQGHDRDVSEERLAPYVHDRHRADHGVRDYCWRCAVTGADRVISGLPRGRWLVWLRSRPMSALTRWCGRMARLARRLAWFRSRWTG